MKLSRMTRKYGVDQYAENASYWINVVRSGADRYRKELTDASIVEAIGECASLEILDAGCGEGYLSRRLASLGARVSGVDASPALIEAAQAATTDGADFTVASVDDLPFASGSFDAVVANHLLNDLSELSTPFREFARVLRPGGRFVALFLHPCFYLPRAERDGPGGMSPARYFAQRSVAQRFAVAGTTSPSTVSVWFRPLEEVMRCLTAAEFAVTALSEPHPDEAVMASNPWWQENFARPMFMLTVAERR